MTWPAKPVPASDVGINTSYPPPAAAAGRPRFQLLNPHLSAIVVPVGGEEADDGSSSGPKKLLPVQTWGHSVTVTEFILDEPDLLRWVVNELLFELTETVADAGCEYASNIECRVTKSYRLTYRTRWQRLKDRLLRRPAREVAEYTLFAEMRAA